MADGDELLELTCPDPACGARWWMTYAQLREHRVVYRGKADPESAVRYEEYFVTCPNPRHGEKVVIRLAVEE